MTSPYCRSEKRIDSKGAKCENQLEPLRDEYNKYRKANNLWKEVKRQFTYEIFDDKLSRVFVDGEPEKFCGK